MGAIGAGPRAPLRPAVFALLLLAAAAPRIWAAWADHGIYWPDEIYQSLEPGHRFAFGYGVRAWEFKEGGRSWLFPGALGVLLKASSALGVDSGLALATVAKLAMAAVSVLGVYGAMRLAQLLGGAGAAMLAGLLAAAFPPLLLFGSRCLAETPSATLLVLAALALVRGGPREAVLAGALSGVAVFLRYPNGIVLLGFLAWLVAARRRDEAQAFVLAALAVGWLGGLLDWLTWGVPFKPLIVYLRYNLTQQAALYGTAGAGYYAATLWSACGPALAALALGVLLAARRAPALLLIAGAYVAIHSAIGHKELRFLVPVLPLLLALAAVGLAGVIDSRISPRLTVLAGVVLALALAQRATTLTFADAGQYQDEPAGALAPWHSGDGANRLLSLAGRQDDVCGVWIAGIQTAWQGSYTYLHRNVPLAGRDEPRVNYAIAPDAPLPAPLARAPQARPGADFTVIARSRGWTLYRRDGGCR